MGPKAAKQNVSLARLGPSMESLTLAVLAWLVILIFRADFHRSLPVLALENLAYAVLPFLFLGWLTQRYAHQPGILTDKKWNWTIQSVSVFFAMLPMLVQAFLRPFGIGDAFEIVALTCLMNGCWFLAVFSLFGKLDRASVMIGGALVLFVCFMSQSAGVFFFAFCYVLISLWWLLGNYWNRVKVKAIDGDSNTLPVRGAVLGASVLMVTIIGAVAASFGPLADAVAIKGFFPSSGGDSWYDAYARSGIGDGDMLTAGKNATTSGAVDSEDFIEDQKASMYDVLSDKYEGPIRKKKKQNRAVAINAKSKHMHTVIQSEQRGKTFRTVRQPKDPKTIDLENRIDDALLFIEGPVPARFTMDCYDNFDGWDWDQTEFESDSKYLVDRLIQIEKHFGKPWYVLRNIQRDYLTSHRTHRVKIMRLEDEVLPAPPLLRSWHIYKVDRKGLFHWNKQGLVRMGGEFIAPHTMIDVVSSIPNYYVLRNSKNLSSANQPSTWWDWIDSWLGVTSKPGFRVKSVSPIETDKESPYIQVPDTESRKSLKSLVKKLTDGVPVGWQQIEAITNHFRNEFELDPASTPTEDCEDSVEWFLESKKGPAYLFATAATMALRTAGYRTRYASGYVVTYDDYDRLAGQSYITSDNFHMWPEVSVDGWHWLAVEPTPGYPIPCNTLTLKQRLVSAITFLWTTVFRNPLTTFLSGLLLFFGIRYRKSLLARAGWAGWGLAVFVMPVHRLKLTRKLIDLRFWAANSPRPSFVSPSNWYSKVDADGAEDFIRLWQSSYFNSNFDRKSSSQEIYRACREAVKTLTLQRIRSHQNQTTLERTK